VSCTTRFYGERTVQVEGDRPGLVKWRSWRYDDWWNAIAAEAWWSDRRTDYWLARRTSRDSPWFGS